MKQNHPMCNITLQDIEPFLRENAYPYYSGDTDESASKWQDAVYRAYLHSLPKDILSQLIEKWKWDNDCPRSLRYKAVGVLKSKLHDELAATPSSTLLEWYADKKSGKRTIAIKELMIRYRSETFEVQQQILSAFIMGGMKEMEWAGRRLRYHWMESLASCVDLRWKATHNPVLASIILRHFPDDYVLAQQEELGEASNYAYVYARLVHVEGLRLDIDRLSTPEMLYVMVKWDMGNSMAISIDMLVDSLLNEYFDDEENIMPTDVSLILWALGKLGMTETIIRLKPKLEKLRY